jgi:lipoprotein NlpI
MAEFATAVNLAPKNAYFMIWLHLIRAQMGEDDRRELEANAENLDRAKWPWPVVAFQLGTMSPERLEALAASADDAVKRNEQQCEATYYLGAHHASADRKDEARRLFRSALEICPRNFFEFSAANLELKRLE